MICSQNCRDSGAGAASPRSGDNGNVLPLKFTNNVFGAWRGNRLQRFGSAVGPCVGPASDVVPKRCDVGSQSPTPFITDSMIHPHGIGECA
jgi:hypothetical protein